MKRLLKSVIDVDSTITQENLVFNFQRLLSAHIEWGRHDDERIYQFVRGYFEQQLEMPSLATLRDYFTRIDDVEVSERLKDVEAATSYVRTNFSHLLTTILEDQNKIKAIKLCKEAEAIIARGLEIDGERKQGVRDGLVYLAQKSNDLIVPNFNARIRGDIREDGQAMWDEYVTAKLNKDKVWGKFTGLNEIDKVCRGAKKGELWVHAAYPGELKTSFASNWCYNLVTHYKTNVVYVSLEMPYEQVRRNIYSIHTANAKWGDLGYKPLDYRKIRDGELTPEEELFYKRSIDDFTTNPDHCHFEILTPEREMTMADIRMEVELLHKQMEVGLVVIDHGQWVEARKSKKNKDYTIELNSVVRDAKRFALHFNHREGIPVLLLFQINRQGKDDAEKNAGVYKMKAITYANEVEKTADIITTTFLDDVHRRDGTTKFSNLKNRDNPLFPPFIAGVNFTSRRISNLDKFSTATSGLGIEEQNEAVRLMGQQL